MQNSISEQEKIRRECLNKILELGIDPYPAEIYDVNTTSKKSKKSLMHIVNQKLLLRAEL